MDGLQGDDLSKDELGVEFVVGVTSTVAANDTR